MIDNRAHSTFDRKIEKAAEMRGKGVSATIVGEQRWAGQLRAYLPEFGHLLHHQRANLAI